MAAQAFEEFGTVTEAAVIMERDNPMRSRGFGFVTFDDADVAQVRPRRLNVANVSGVDVWVVACSWRRMRWTGRCSMGAGCASTSPTRPRLAAVAVVGGVGAVVVVATAVAVVGVAEVAAATTTGEAVAAAGGAAAEVAAGVAAGTTWATRPLSLSLFVLGFFFCSPLPRALSPAQFPKLCPSLWHCAPGRAERCVGG